MSMAESQKETEVDPAVPKEVNAAKGGKKSSKRGIGKTSFAVRPTVEGCVMVAEAGAIW